MKCCLVPGVDSHMCVRMFCGFYHLKVSRAEEEKKKVIEKLRRCSYKKCISSFDCVPRPHGICFAYFSPRLLCRARDNRPKNEIKKSNFSRSRHGKFFRFVFILHFFMVMLTREPGWLLPLAYRADACSFYFSGGMNLWAARENFTSKVISIFLLCKE